MEFLVELFGFILIDIVFSGIGWVCLYVWYRNTKKVEKIKNENYAGLYSAAGRIMILNLIAGVGAIAVFGILIYSLATWIYRAVYPLSSY